MLIKNAAKTPELILLTRSKEANKQLMQHLINGGQIGEQFTFAECNLINYQIVYPLEIDRELLISKYDYFIITSNFAATHFPAISSIVKAKNILVVGQNSAKLLQKKGHNIVFLARDAQAIETKLLNEFARREKIIYLSANNITTEMPPFIKREIFYYTEYKDKLTNREIAIFKQKPAYILVYSENSAKALLQLILENNLLSVIENSVILAISEKVAKIFTEYFVNIKSFDGQSEKILYFLQRKYNLSKLGRR